MDSSDRSDFIASMESIDTASDAIALVKDSFHTLYLSYGEEFLNWVREAFTSELWAQQNVLINPSEIPLNETTPLTVVSDSTIPIAQEVRSTVGYYGDVQLKLLDGVAYVYDTQQKVTVNGGMLYAFGQTAVEAMGRSGLFLKDHSKATVSGEVKVLATDLTFVECTAGRPSIQASNEAQILVSGGSVDLIMDDHTRCAITTKETPARPHSVNLAGDSLLYTPSLDPSFIRGKNHSKINAGLICGQNWHVTPEEMRDLIVPRCNERKPDVRRCIETPIALERLKEEMLALLPKDTPSELTNNVMRAESEGEVCQAISTHIPDLVNYGMTGDFLRSHFTESTLNANGIYTHYGTQADYSTPQDRDALYFFGNQYVNANEFEQELYCYENTLVLNSQHTDWVYVGQKATAFVYNNAAIKANGNAKVIANAKAHINAFQESEVLLNGKSFCASYNNSKVTAHDQSDVIASDTTRTLLHDESTATAWDSSMVLTDGNNKVSAHDKATIAFGVYDSKLNPEIKVYDKEVKLIGLDSRVNFACYKSNFLQNGEKLLNQRVRLNR